MAGKIKNFLDREGRYFSRISVPERLRPYLGNKTELRTALGGDRRKAIAQHTIEIAVLQMRLDEAEQQCRDAAEKKLAPVAPVDTWSIQQIATDNYLDRLAFDTELRETTHLYAQVGVDDQLATLLKRGYSGLLEDGKLAVLVVGRVKRYKHLGRTKAQFGSREWRLLAMALCRSEYEAMARAAERDEGDFSGRPAPDFIIAPTIPPLLQVETALPAPLAPEAPAKNVPLQSLFDQYLNGRQKLGKGKSLPKRWQPVITDLIRFLGHNDARVITKADIVRWRDEKLDTLAQSTVKKVYLSSIQAVLSWAVEHDILPTNVAATVKQELPKNIRIREKGYTREEAVRILKAASSEQRTEANGAEPAQSIATRRWVPWLCAFTGARVVEMTQMRREDVRWEGETMVLRISPDAGTVKTGEYRDVPVHPQLIKMGFDTFVRQTVGPLFYVARPGASALKAAEASAAKLRKWMTRNNLTVKGVLPNHGWRHHFKTFAREARIEDRVIDGITGHASRTAGDHYGDVTLLTKINAIGSLPDYVVGSE
ncbi:tyrosine-type recombinase/integrase [Sulfitobacter guttiformis]|uniref:Phage integrase family protein n=1 Tax=Sulfitobacter guttiformis TaxID=74349 RepID=A0A420DTR8_9RHOB|nr:tyrosine-type recombinase/integrase [Sulfitobacter guttiformis]KIN71160.1 Phage integrase [Sulfitobacter guttiformis KCTC 32187]RKE97635.1 phage integrase family protein [Sulfitobacter guttiformis]